MKKRTYIVKIGIRFHSATTSRDEAVMTAQQLESHHRGGSVGEVHLWSRPHCGPDSQLVEEDFWAGDKDEVL